MKSAGSDLRIAVSLGLTIFVWASAFAGIRAGLEAYGPGQVALLRLLVASGALAIYAAWVRMGMPEVRDLPVIALSGFLAFAVYHIALNYGELTVGSGPAAILVNTAPIFTALLATAFLGERLRLWGWVGMLISFFGAALIGLGEGGDLRLAPGTFVILVSAVAVSVYIVVQRPYLRKYGPLAFTTYAVWAGTLFTLIFLPGLPEAVREAPIETTLAVVYLGLFPTAVAYVTYAYALSRLPAARGASFLYLIAPVAFVIAWLWLGEVPTLLSAVGGVIVLAGVVIVNSRGR
ncbi:MAG TPA: DMT family transporter [Rubrobacteraceae bacterium]|nr:DMT family transporter [Rubrobacteraceae bacterium]